MKTHLVLTVAAAALLGVTSRAQENALEDRPFAPSPAVVKGVVAALSDESEEVAALAVRSLADWQQAGVADEVAKLLPAGKPESVRLEAFEFFARLGPKAKPRIAEILKHASDADPNIRLAILGVVLKAQASGENADAISALLDDPRSDVRVAAAKCLGQAGPAAAKHRPALLAALAKTGSPELKAAALRALSQIGGLTVAEVDAFRPMIRDRDAEVRIAAWAATLDALVSAKGAGTLSDEKDQAVREALLAQFQLEAPEIKAAIIEDAGKNKATVEASVASLVKQIRTGSPEIKAAALRVLGKAGEAGIAQLPLLGEQAKDPNSIVRAAAIDALGNLGPAAAKPGLAIIANALLDESDLVRDEALRALPQAGDALRNFPYRIRDVYAAAAPGVRTTLIKALAARSKILGMDADDTARGRAALTDPDADIRIAMAFVMGQLGAKIAAPLLPELLALLKDPDPGVRGAAAIALRAFATDAAAKGQFRQALRPLLKDGDSQVRWATLDVMHELEPAQEPGLVVEIAALIKDEEQPVRVAAVRALGAAGPAAKSQLAAIIHFFNDDPAMPPYAAAQALLELGTLTPQEVTSVLEPLYVYADLLPLTRLTAYGASGGEPDGLLVIRLLGRSRSATKDIVTRENQARAVVLLQDGLRPALQNEKLKAEITARLAEVKAVP